jgi:uncharacterized repeat protein (TIGR01451 family)
VRTLLNRNRHSTLILLLFALFAALFLFAPAAADNNPDSPDCPPPCGQPTPTPTDDAVTPTATGSPTASPTRTPSATPSTTHTPTNTPTPSFGTSKDARVYRDAPPSPAPGEVRPGDRIVYTVLVTNTSLIDALLVTISDGVPPGTTYVPGTAATNGDSLILGNTILATANQLLSSRTLSLTFTVIVNQQPPGNIISNCAIIQSLGADPPDPPCVNHTVSAIIFDAPWRYFLPILVSNGLPSEP